MSRTHRKFHSKVYRHPHTFNEIKQLDALFHDEDVTLRNRDKSKLKSLPTVYDDIVKSGFYEDYDWKHCWS